MSNSTAMLPSTVSTVRVLPEPPSLLATGIRLPEVRWAAISLAFLLLAWGAQSTGAPTLIWATLYAICYVSGGWEPLLAGLQALRERTLDVDLLMIVAAIAAAAIGQVLDGALLIVIFATSGALEALVTQRTADSVSSLLTLAPERATLIENGVERTVDTSSLMIGQTILVRPGERVGADGTILSGDSELDQQAITGESIPVIRRPGDPVLSGSVNGTGALYVQVDTPASESVVARIVSLVEKASETKAKTQLFIEKIEQRYSFGVIVATLLVFFVPYLLFDVEFDAALLRAITFMIVASPCAVVLATMPPLLAGIANAGRHGVLVKSAAVMESLGRSTLVAFDKTGTITRGVPVVARIDTTDGQSANDLLAIAAAVEQLSEHPLGRAIHQEARNRQLPIPEVRRFRSLPGHGVSGDVDGRSIVIERSDDVSHAGTRVAIIADGTRIGTILLEDEIRQDAAATVHQLAGMTDLPVHLLTGDNPEIARQVADTVGIGTVHADLLPEDKTRIVAELEQSGSSVLLIGDGVNDAPALASANASIAMGRHGSDLAIETADAIIVRDELASIPNLISLSRKARKLVLVNLGIAATFIIVLVTWDLVGHLPLPLAVAGHEGSTVIVALNGFRLLRSHHWTT